MSDSPQVTHNLQLLLLSPDKNIACGACGVWKVTGALSRTSLTRNVMAVIDKPGANPRTSLTRNVMAVIDKPEGQSLDMSCCAAPEAPADTKSQWSRHMIVSSPSQALALQLDSESLDRRQSSASVLGFTACDRSLQRCQRD
ncbi:hypothetical protein DPX16_10192 [Anabarilius grahami]|uniref:Ig-like domain-containing protein n=1 Tax=Anabarilius grahami TaxID=495550 RepID=A0A3N0XYH7_ANAGA|nr:hypothetical protein DPX16_10192 [Anabarilius grahami]